jgi:hypothetical protein
MEATNFRTLPKAGANGDACSFTSSITLSAAAISTRIEWARLPPGTELQEVVLVTDALGASSTLGVGELFDSTADGTTAAASLVSAASTASAGRIDSAFHPKVYNTPVTLTSTVGGAAATGKVTAIIKYRYIGTN